VPEDATSIKHLKEAAPDPAGLTKPRDLGRNGSYVVFRQLQQDVKEFWKDIHQRSAADPDLRKKLAAKMVGRWPNGAPLVLEPDVEPPSLNRDTENDFWYRDDLDGDACPIGAHIRRTNPRDGLHPDTHQSLVVADRHRLLRRGRAYGQPIAASFDPDEILTKPDPHDGRRGLHFICFNTDISRQFEFVQQTWMNSGKFDGLHGDPDAIVAARGAGGAGNFTVQQCPVRRRYTDLKQFVTTVGGAYLFMPGFRALRYLVDD
jgi:Dyp-type peroxidase family